MIKKILLIIILTCLIFTGCSNRTIDEVVDKTIITDTSNEQVTEVTTVTTLERNDTSESDETVKETSQVNGGKEKSDTYGEIFDDVKLLSGAIKSDDESILTDERDIFVYNEVKRIISENITDNMSVYEKELCIHDYLIRNCEYDPGELSIFKKADAESINPYGLLKNKKAICLGYTKTFQLFMNVLDIPCVVIHSETTKGEEHAWNMVMIDNEWYHVDVTWDDPVPDRGVHVKHTYFNVTDELMEEEHVWEEDDFPSATSENYKYKK